MSALGHLYGEAAARRASPFICLSWTALAVLYKKLIYMIENGENNETKTGQTVVYTGPRLRPW
jgi:hypothetical protein